MPETPLFRIGSGFDSHRFADGRKLVLCGRAFPGERGLLGHSDADAPVHALIDALLGALALGDIGRHFPDSDPAWLDISSIVLLKQVLALPEFRAWTIGNADLTIVTEAPKLAVHMEEMRQNLAAAMNVESDRISVKAKTAEKLGPVGAGEALEAHAIVLLMRKN